MDRYRRFYENIFPGCNEIKNEIIIFWIKGKKDYVRYLNNL
jgi:hypothetical protein